MENPEHILITVPLTHFLNGIIRIKEYANVDNSIAELISKADPQETLCHIEYPDRENGNIGITPSDENPSGSIHIPKVWYIKAWKDSAENWYRQKKVSAERSLAFNLQTEKVDELAQSIKRKLTNLPYDMCKDIATQIVVQGNLEVAKAFNVESLLDANTAAVIKAQGIITKL